MDADARGHLLRLSGDGAVVANLGGVGLYSFRRCDDAASHPAAKPAPVVSGSATRPSERVRDPAFQQAYQRTLGALARDGWLASMNGPGADLAIERIDGVDHTVAAHCKSHECREYSSVVFHEPVQGRVYLLVSQLGRHHVFGSPAAAVQERLLASWRNQWRASTP